MVRKDKIEKIITYSISIIHAFIKTTINKLLITSIHNQFTTNQLAITLLTKEVTLANILGEWLKRLMLLFYKWQRVTNMTLKKLKNILALKNSIVILSIQVVLIFKDDYKVLEVNISEQRIHVLIEHIVRA
jgi:hypothetical protein